MSQACATHTLEICKVVLLLCKIYSLQTLIYSRMYFKSVNLYEIWFSIIANSLSHNRYAMLCIYYIVLRISRVSLIYSIATRAQLLDLCRAQIRSSAFLYPWRTEDSVSRNTGFNCVMTSREFFYIVFPTSFFSCYTQCGAPILNRCRCYATRRTI